MRSSPRASDEEQLRVQTSAVDATAFEVVAGPGEDPSDGPVLGARRLHGFGHARARSASLRDASISASTLSADLGQARLGGRLEAQDDDRTGVGRAYQPPRAVGVGDARAVDLGALARCRAGAL